MVSDRPVSVYLPLAVLATGGPSEAGPGMTTWLAMSPFTGQKSTFARQLVASRSAEREEVRLLVEKVLARPISSLLAEFERLAVEKRRAMEDVIERRFTSRIHAHRELFELLTMLEFHATGAGYQRTEDREHAIRYAWRCYELMLRRIVRDRPVELGRQRRQRQQDRRTDQQHARDEAEFQHRLASDAQRIGLNYGEARQLLGKASRDLVRNAMGKPNSTFMTAPVLIAAAVLSAANQPERHPLAIVARTRPHLIANLMYLSSDRNDVSHHAPADLHGDLVQAAYMLTHEFTKAFLAADPPPHDSAAARRERIPADA
jgi:hypothetical protein